MVRGMTEPSNDNRGAIGDVALVFPVVGWEALVGEEPVAVMRIGYVRNPREGVAYRAGEAEPAVAPLGFTASQCRTFAADLLRAADALEAADTGEGDGCDAEFIREGLTVRGVLQSAEDALLKAGMERFDAKTEAGVWTWQTTEYARRESEREP